MTLNQPLGDLPPADGLSAHVRLSFIMGEITSKVYGVSSRKRESFHVLSHVDDILNQLSEWAESLPPGMQLLEGSPAYEDSNKITLHMMRNQVSNSCLGNPNISQCLKIDGPLSSCS